MYNLLPQENDKELRREYRLRLAVIVFAFLVIVGIAVNAVLFPSYLATIFEEQNAVRQEQSFKGSNATSSAAVLTALQNTENEVTLVNRLQTESVHDLISQLVSYETPGITLIGFSIGQPAQSSATSRPVTLTGVASTREALATFSQSLQAQKDLSGVDVPISDFSVQKNIGFTLNLSMKTQPSIH